jgi:hypothetical protein
MVKIHIVVLVNYCRNFINDLTLLQSCVILKCEREWYFMEELRNKFE